MINKLTIFMLKLCKYIILHIGQICDYNTINISISQQNKYCLPTFRNVY